MIETSTPSRERLGWAAATLMLVVMLAVLFGPALIGRKAIDGAAMLPHEDTLYGPVPAHGVLPGRGGIDRTPELYDQPWEAQAWRELRAGQLPLWQPYNAFGKPLLASAQALPFNPLKLLLWHGPCGAAQSWFLVMRLACAGLGALVLARMLGLSPFGGALAAMAFTFNGNFIYHFQYSELGATPLLPWLLIVAERFIATPNVRWASAFGLLIGLSGLSGHPEAALFVSGTAVLSAIAGSVQQPDRWSRFGLLTYACCLGAALAMCTILPMFELIHAGDSYLLHQNPLPWQLFTDYSYAKKFKTLASLLLTGTALKAYDYNAYVGVLALALAPLGLRTPSMRRPSFTLIGVALLSMVTCWPGEHLYVLPIVIHGTYTAPLIALGLALLGGAGFDRVLESPRRSAPVVILVLLCLAGARMHFLAEGLVGARLFLLDVVVAGVALGALAFRPHRAAALLLLGSAAVQLAWTAHLMLPLQKPFSYEPPPVIRYLQAQKQIFRVAGGLQALLPDSNVMYRLDSLESYEVFNVKRYVSYMNALEGRVDGSLQEVGLSESAIPSLLDLANVRYVLTADPQPNKGPFAGFPVRLRQGHLDLRENPRAMPRAWVSYRAAFVPDEATAALRLKRDASSWRDRVLLETPGGTPPADWKDAAMPHTSVQVLRRQAQDMVLGATVAHPGWLVLSDLYYPGWQATVDGRPAQILPADVAFRAVFLRPGKHRIEFRYAPASASLGLAITLLALFVGIALLAFRPGGRFLAVGMPAP